MAYREEVAIVNEGAGRSASPRPFSKGGTDSYGKKKGKGGGGSSSGQGKRGKGGGAGAAGGGRQFGRAKASSAGDMSNILFRGLKGGVEGRLPREVCVCFFL